MQTGLKSKHVVVTGASGGIGAEIVRAFCAEQANVVVHFHQNEKRANEICNSFGTSQTIPISADLTKETDVVRMFEQAEKKFGPIDCFIANAGVWPSTDQSIDKISMDRWQATIAANLNSTFLSMKYFFASADRHSLVAPSAVMIGSTAGMFGEAGHSDYSAAKAAIVGGLLPSLKNEIVRISPLGRVNVISPGWTMTPMTKKFAADETAMKQALQTIPLRKFGKPQDVAAAAVFLCSDQAGHITGQVITTGGGMEGRVLFSPEEIDLDPQ